MKRNAGLAVLVAVALCATPLLSESPSPLGQMNGCDKFVLIEDLTETGHEGTWVVNSLNHFKTYTFEFDSYTMPPFTVEEDGSWKSDQTLVLNFRFKENGSRGTFTVRKRTIYSPHDESVAAHVEGPLEQGNRHAVGVFSGWYTRELGGPQPGPVQWHWVEIVLCAPILPE